PSPTAFTRTPWASSSNSSLSPARTPNLRRISRGIVTCPLLVTFACFFIADSPIPYFITILLTFPETPSATRLLPPPKLLFRFLCGLCASVAIQFFPHLAPLRSEERRVG